MDYVCKSSSVFLLGTAKLSSAYAVCTPGERKDWGRAEGAEIQDSGQSWLKSYHQSPLSTGKLTSGPAGLAVAPYLPCAPAGRAPVTSALA